MVDGNNQSTKIKCLIAIFDERHPRKKAEQKEASLYAGGEMRDRCVFHEKLIYVLEKKSYYLNKKLTNFNAYMSLFYYYIKKHFI